MTHEIQSNLVRQADIAGANHALEISRRMPPSQISTEAATIDFAIPPDPWDTDHLGTFIQRYNSIGPAKRMLQTQGEFSASFAQGFKGLRYETVSGKNEQGPTKKDITIFHRAAFMGELVDKDAIQEGLIDPTVRRVVAPAVRAYEAILRSAYPATAVEGKRNAKRVARRVGTRVEGIVFDAATAPSKQRSGVFEELGRFVSTYLPAEAVHAALRSLKLDLIDTGIPTPVRQEIFRSIATKPKR